MKKKMAKIPPEIIHKLAQELGRNQRTIRDYIKAGCPITARGYDRAEVEAWLKRRSGVDEDHDKWAAEYRKWRSRRQKLAYQVEAGKLVDREVAKKKLVEFAELYRSTLLRLPRIAANEIYRLTGNTSWAYDVESAVFRHCNQTLGEIYEYLKRKYRNTEISDRPIQAGSTGGETDQSETEIKENVQAQSGQETVTDATETASAPGQVLQG